MKNRTVRGWVLANSGGHPIGDTFSRTRGAAIFAYDRLVSGADSWSSDRKKYGLRAVKCTLTTLVAEVPA